jgi:hypothetical protein
VAGLTLRRCHVATTSKDETNSLVIVLLGPVCHFRLSLGVRQVVQAIAAIHLEFPETSKHFPAKGKHPPGDASIRISREMNVAALSIGGNAGCQASPVPFYARATSSHNEYFFVD